MKRFLKQLFGSKTNPIRRERPTTGARPRLVIEGLEDRTVPSTLQITGGLLNYTAGAGVANNLAVSVSNGTYTVTDTAETINVVGLAGATGSGTNTVTFSAASVPAAGMVLNLGDMADAVTVRSTVNAVSVKAGDGNDTVDVGTFAGGTLSGIQANVTVDGGLGTDLLRVNDSASFLGNYTVTSAQVAANGRAVTYGGSENLVVTGAFAGDTFTVRSTASGVQTTLNAGPNGATFNVGSTDNTLDAIKGALTLNGAPPTAFRSTDVNLFDQGSVVARNYTFQANGVARTSAAAITYNTVQHVTLDAGSANDTATVLGSAPGLALTLNMGAGDDRVNFGSATTSMDGTHSAVTVNGGDGTDSIVLNDQAAAAGSFYSFNNSAVSRNFANVLNYATAESVTLNATNFNDTVSLFNSVAATPITLKLGAGDDWVSIENAVRSLDDIQGTVTVDGQAGSDRLTLGDDGEDVFHNYTVTANSVTRDGAAPFGYANLENLEINAGSEPQIIIFVRPFDEITTGNQFFVKGTSAATTLGLGSTLDAVVVGNDANSLDGIKGALNINGGGFLTLNDQGDNNGNSYTVTSNTVARSGAALISYDLNASVFDFEKLTINAGAFNDTVNLQSQTQAVALNTGAGNDTVTLGSSATGLSRIGDVTIDGGAGTDAIVLNDDVGGVIGFPSDYDVFSDVVDRFSSRASNDFDILAVHYAGAESLTINAGAGDDTFFVASTAATTPVFLNGGRGSDTFDIGDPRVPVNGVASPPFANLLGKVTVDGQDGTDTLDYSALAVGIRVDLALGTATGAAGGVKNVENVSGSQGNDIIVGNDASNFIFGNGGRDILIGRGNGDLLFGGAGDDILIGGSTVYDLNPAALESLMAEWGRTDLTGTAQDQYTARINHLLGAAPGGLNGSTRLDLSKVVDDGIDDGLRGNGPNDTAPDWFFVNGTDVIGDFTPTERVN